MRKIGVLTGGGDCPGLNAAIRAVVRKSDQMGYTVLGFHGGWKGLLSMSAVELDLRAVSGILPRGGTILGTSRTNPFKTKGGADKVIRNLENFGLEALVAIGGEDTLGVASRMFQKGVPVVGVPKTIDNDLMGTDFTIGFDTAVSIATEAIDRLHSTAESHNRVMIVEVMGRHAGWIATYAGLAGGADVILIPEKPFKVHEVSDMIIRRHNRGKNFSICVVSEGAKIVEDGKEKLILHDSELDDLGHVQLGGIGEILRKQLSKNTGFDTRVTSLGHVLRGGVPTAYDRVLATRFGAAAVDLIAGKNFGKFPGLVNGRVEDVDLSVVEDNVKTVDLSLYEIAEVFFG